MASRLGEAWGISPVLSPAAKLDPAVRPVSGLTSHLILQAGRHRLPALEPLGSRRSGFKDADFTRLPLRGQRRDGRVCDAPASRAPDSGAGE